jgi:hypothetical protein
MSRRDEAHDLETLKPSAVEGVDDRPSVDESADLSPSTSRLRRSQVLAALTFVLAGVLLGSALTLSLSDRDRPTPTPPSIAPTSVLAQNVVTRLRQATQIGDWTIVAKDFERASNFVGLKSPSGPQGVNAPPGQVWLIADLTVKNRGSETRVFDSQLVVARYADGGDWPEVGAQWNGTLTIGPNQVLPLMLVFSVPASSHIYSLVIRQSLEAEKQSGDAVEIDLNCC